MLSKYGVARHVYITIPKRAVADFAVSADWTPAAGDVKISKDGGLAADVTNLPTAITMGNTAVWDFSLTATEMEAALVVVTVAATAAALAAVAAFVDTEVAAILAAVDTETAAILAAVDTEVAAIKAKTDNLPASPAAVSDIPTANQVRDAVINATRPGGELAAPPAAAPSIIDLLMWLYVKERYKERASSVAEEVYVHNSAGTVIGTAPTSDALGVFTRDAYA